MNTDKRRWGRIRVSPVLGRGFPVIRTTRPRRTFRVRLSSALVLSMVLALVEVAAGYPVTVKDARGKSIIIRSAPRRIVSLAPGNTEILFALGLGNRVVGVTKFCDYPSAARKKAKVGDQVISVERVIALKPDLILAHAYLNNACIGQLEAAKKTVIAIDPKTYGQVMSDISMIGRATGRTARANAIVRKMRAARDKTLKRKRAGHRVRTLVVIDTSKLWAAGPATFVDEMIRYAHGENIAHDSRPGFNQFPVERAIARKPEAIIVDKGLGRFFWTSPVWRKTKVVRDGCVYEMDFDLLVRPGPRLAEGLVELSKKLR